MLVPTDERDLLEENDLPVGALIAPLIAEAILPEAVLGTLGGTLATAGIGGALGAGSGALLGELTGEGPGKGALSGAIGAASGPIGGLAGEALGIAPIVGEVVGAAAGGAGGAALTGQNPLIGAAESAAVPLTNAAFGSGGIFGSTPSATVTPAATSTGAAGPAGAAGSVGASTAASSSPIPLDPTAGGGVGPSGGGASGGGPGGAGGGAGMDAAGAMGLSSPDPFAPSSSGGGPGDPWANSGGTGGTWSSAGGGGGGGFASDIMGLVKKNPGMLLSGGLLASQLFRGNQQYPAEQTLQGLATNTGTQGAALSSYIQSGTLPPGAQQAVTQATEGSKATLRSRFAQMGLSGSTMEAEALSNVDRQAAAQTFQFADQLLARGANFTQISAQIQAELLKTQAGTDAEFQRSLMTFASGLGGLRGA
jgi:hypothetical protein